MKKNNILNEKIVNGRKVWEIGSFVIYPSKEYEKKLRNIICDVFNIKKQMFENKKPKS
jgi:hypothetical protein